MQPLLSEPISTIINFDTLTENSVRRGLAGIFEVGELEEKDVRDQSGEHISSPITPNANFLLARRITQHRKSKERARPTLRNVGFMIILLHPHKSIFRS